MDPDYICKAIDFQYNERKYDERGWCTFEEAVSDEMIVRLNPNMRAALEVLPPKKVVLGDVREHDIVMWAETRVETIVERIVGATFTGAGDQKKVIALYMDYAERISQAVLPLITMLPQDKPKPMLNFQAPAVLLSSPIPIRLASSQLVLLRHQSGTQFGAVGRAVAKWCACWLAASSNSRTTRACRRFCHGSR